MQKIYFEQWQEEFFRDKNLMKIFLSLTDSPKTIKKISAETGIPLNTVYHKIRKLREKKLVAVSGSINKDGTKSFLYSEP